MNLLNLEVGWFFILMMSKIAILNMVVPRHT